MDRKPLLDKMDAGDYIGIVQHLIGEVERLESLLANERMLRKQIEAAAEKKANDDERYSKCVEKYQEICKIVNSHDTNYGCF